MTRFSDEEQKSLSRREEVGGRGEGTHATTTHYIDLVEGEDVLKRKERGVTNRVKRVGLGVGGGGGEGEEDDGFLWNLFIVSSA